MSDAPQKCLYCGRLHQPKSDKDGFFCSRSCSVAFRLSLDPEYGEHYRANDTDPELAALRQKVADQAAEIERLTKLLDDGELSWEDSLWLVTLPKFARHWRDALSEGGAISETRRKTPEKESE